ncbi:MAG TPA: cellulase family glycosylhydrolase, partial [Cytophagales bacterium]
AQEIIDSDPQKNVVFSIHMYAGWYSGTTNAASWRFQVEAKLQEYKDKNIPIMVGEFGWEGTTDVPYDPRVVMSKTAQLGQGWFFWSWFDQPTYTYYNVVKDQCTGYNSDADLTTGGNAIVNGTNGMKARAKRATIYNATAREGTLAVEKGGLSLDVFPNPAAGEVNLELKGFGKHAPANIKVLDLNGRSVFGTQVVTDENGAKSVRLRTAPFGNGVRVISVQSGTRHLVQRLVVVE